MGGVCCSAVVLKLYIPKYIALYVFIASLDYAFISKKQGFNSDLTSGEITSRSGLLQNHLARAGQPRSGYH